MTSLLQQGLDKLRLELAPCQIKSLECYAQCVLKFNESYNLMKAGSLDELYTNHVLDSLAACHAIGQLVSEIQQETERICLDIADVGSGGGCPGIPLAIAFPQQQFTLIERMEKRCAFLKDTLSAAGIHNASVLCAKAADVPHVSFDLAVLRAFHPFDEKTTPLLLSIVRRGGIIAAYKAKREKIDSEMQDVRHLIPTYQVIKLEVPFLEDHERNLVVVRKDEARGH